MCYRRANIFQASLPYMHTIAQPFRDIGHMFLRTRKNYPCHQPKNKSSERSENHVFRSEQDTILQQTVIGRKMPAISITPTNCIPLYPITQTMTLQLILLYDRTDPHDSKGFRIHMSSERLSGNTISLYHRHQPMIKKCGEKVLTCLRCRQRDLP
jgi:hypothetical protein